MEKSTENKKGAFWAIISLIVGCIIAYILINGYEYEADYTPLYQSQFTDTCLKTNAGSDFCGCIYDHLTKEYSFTQSKFFDQYPTNDDTRIAMQKLQRECAE